MTLAQVRENAVRPNVLKQLVKAMFSHYSYVCASFPSASATSYDISKSSNLGISFSSVKKAYSIFSSYPEVRTCIDECMDALLKRIGWRIESKLDLRGLVIILECPWLRPGPEHRLSDLKLTDTPEPTAASVQKRVYGILSNLCNDLHQCLVHSFSRHLSQLQLVLQVEQCNAFITQNLQRYHGRSNRAYGNDWRVKAGSRCMALFFASNGSHRSKRGEQIPLHEFYNTMVDYVDLISDFDSWEHRKAKFAFCQYPFLISMGSKMKILEYDAKRQMEVKAREAFFSTIFQRQLTNPHLMLKVRRDCLIEDSLNQIGMNEMELKKGLKIEFVGEDGVDAGGLRKEWFLLLCREVFDPQYGMFTYDEESNYCYFSPSSFETSSQYFLIGVVLGLAIYNSTNLDINFPPALYKKLLGQPVSIDDLRVFKPTIARSLQVMLNYDADDFDSVFPLDFVATVEQLGSQKSVPLCPGGQRMPVTQRNKHEYVRLYVEYILTTSIAKQFDPMKRGFYHVCGGNALSLFRHEEVETLVRGSGEPLDIDAVRGGAVYEGETRATIITGNEPILEWFWSIFSNLEMKKQRQLLSFITGSDRIPATGTANLHIKISILGGDCHRYPVAHTCFNQLCLYRYATRAKLERLLIRSMEESEGFGLR